MSIGIAMFVKGIILTLWAWIDSKYLITAESKRNAERSREL